MPEAFTVRACSAGDEAMIASLGARLFVQAYGPTHPEPELSRYLARSFSVERFALELRDANVRVLVAETTEGRAIGYAHLRRTLDALPPGVTDTRAVEIIRFYVDAGFHGQGVAQALMKACEGEARLFGGYLLWLSVWQEAHRPQAFYRRAGFEVVGTTTFAFGDRLDDDFVMAKSLPPSVIS